MIVDNEFVNFWKIVDNDLDHYEELMLIINYCKSTIETILLNEDYKNLNLREKKKQCAKQCGCFLLTISTPIEEENYTSAITSSQYELLTEEKQQECIPVLPGDTVWRQKILGKYGQHYGIYIGRIHESKYGYIMEIDPLLDKPEKDNIYSKLSLVFTSTPGVVRCYKNLYEFTFTIPVDDNKYNKDRQKGNFGQENDDTVLNYGKNEKGINLDDNKNLCGVFSRSSINSENPTNFEEPNLFNEEFTDSIDINYIYENLEEAIRCFKIKIWDYNILNSNCEHFSEYITNRKFRATQPLLRNIAIGTASISGIASTATVIAISGASFGIIPTVAVGAAFLYNIIPIIDRNYFNTSRGGGKKDVFIILPQIYEYFKNTNNKIIDELYEYLISNSQYINKIKTENLYKSLILTIIISNEEDICVEINIVKLLLKIHKKFNIIKNEIDDNLLLKQILIQANKININISGEFLNVSDIDKLNPEYLKYIKLIDYIKNSVNLENESDLAFNSKAGNLNIVLSNKTVIPIINATKFENLSETFIGKLLETHGGKKEKKYINKTKRNKKQKNKKQKTKNKKTKNKKQKTKNKKQKTKKQNNVKKYKLI
jgi:hypothetical protein